MEKNHFIKKFSKIILDNLWHVCWYEINGKIIPSLSALNSFDIIDSNVNISLCIHPFLEFSHTHTHTHIYIYINEYQIINLKWHISFVNWLEATKH